MSGTTVDEKLVKWLTKFLSYQTENGRVCRIELMHTVDAEAAERCIALGIEEGAEITELAQEIWECADHDASTRGVGMPQRYVVRIFDTPVGEEHLAVYPFTIRGRAALPYLGGDTESPNEKGITAQLMRTVENQNRLLVHNASAVSLELDRANARARLSEDRELETRRLHQDLLDRSAEREIDKARAVMRAKRTDELIGTGIALLPLLLTKLLQGTSLLPGAQPAGLPAGAVPTQTPRDAAVEAFLRRLTPDEMKGVMVALKGVNQLTMIELFKTYQQPATAQASASRDITIGKLLKALSGDELNNVIRALGELNRESFVQIYDLYVTAHEESQAGMPEVLKDEVDEGTREPH